MTFFALLLKEIRLRVRRERLIWLLVIYVLILGLLEWLVFNATSSSYNIYSLNSTGASIYTTLIILQFLLTLFIAPAFTASAINAEKERQTYDLLLCSRLSSFSLVAGKLAAGLSSALMLIAATIPLFSLVFFFGGIDPLQVVKDQVMFIVTAILVATFALFCSALFARPAVSTAITYMGILFWLIGPYLVQAFVAYASPGGYSSHFMTIPVMLSLGGTTTAVGQAFMPLAFIWSPVVAFNNTPIFSLIPLDYSISNATSGGYSYYSPSSTVTFAYRIAGWFTISTWLLYILISILVIIFFFLLTLWIVKPYPLARLNTWLTQHNKQKTRQAGPVEGGESVDTGTPGNEKSLTDTSTSSTKETSV